MESKVDGPLPAQRNQLARACFGRTVNFASEWYAGRDLPQFSYTAQEVPTATAGHPNSLRDQLGYATMPLLGLIG